MNTQMNVDFINYVANEVEFTIHCRHGESMDEDHKYPESFHMGGYHFNNTDSGHCGTPACVAGWADYLANDNEITPGISDEAMETFMHSRLMELFGIDSQQANDIIMARNAPVELPDISGDWAANMLRNLAETGKVDWENTEPTYR